MTLLTNNSRETSTAGPASAESTRRERQVQATARPSERVGHCAGGGRTGKTSEVSPFDLRGRHRKQKIRQKLQVLPKGRPSQRKSSVGRERRWHAEAPFAAVGNRPRRFSKRASRGAGGPEGGAPPRAALEFQEKRPHPATSLPSAGSPLRARPPTWAGAFAPAALVPRPGSRAVVAFRPPLPP